MKRMIVALLFMLGLVGCQQKGDHEFIIFASHVNMNEELKESLLQRLDNKNIEYIINEQNNVLLKKKDMDKAVICCS